MLRLRFVSRPRLGSAGGGAGTTWAVRNLLGGDQMYNTSRKPSIMGDAAWAILTRDAKTCSGNFFVDDEVMHSEGVSDLEGYSVVPGAELTPDFFV